MEFMLDDRVRWRLHAANRNLFIHPAQLCSIQQWAGMGIDKQDEKENLAETNYVHEE